MGTPPLMVAIIVVLLNSLPPFFVEDPVFTLVCALTSVRQRLPRMSPSSFHQGKAADLPLTQCHSLLSHPFTQQITTGHLPCPRHCARCKGAGSDTDAAPGVTEVPSSHTLKSPQCMSVHLFPGAMHAPFKSPAETVQKFSQGKHEVQ